MRIVSVALRLRQRPFYLHQQSPPRHPALVRVSASTMHRGRVSATAFTIRQPHRLRQNLHPSTQQAGRLMCNLIPPRRRERRSCGPPYPEHPRVQLCVRLLPNDPFGRLPKMRGSRANWWVSVGSHALSPPLDRNDRPPLPPATATPEPSFEVENFRRGAQPGIRR